ncbi:MAG: hypothetical protein WAV50_02845 [Minisyncoccia bacterium]
MQSAQTAQTDVPDIDPSARHNIHHAHKMDREQTIFGMILIVGDRLETNDVYDSSHGWWERVPGVLVESILDLEMSRGTKFVRPALEV